MYIQILNMSYKCNRAVFLLQFYPYIKYIMSCSFEKKHNILHINVHVQ